MIGFKNYSSFLNKNSNIRDNFLKSSVIKNFTLLPLTSKNRSNIIKYKILNNELLSLGLFELKNIKKKFFLKTSFSKKLNNKEKKIIFSYFLNLILDNVEIDNLFVNKSSFFLKIKIKGIQQTINHQKINFRKISSNKKKILTAGPSITEKEKYYAFDATESGWNENWSFYIKKFEELFSKKIERKYSLATSSCTGAMHIALLALNIKKGDEVIVPDMTWVATASVVQAVGAIPVFADINLDDWTISIESIRKLITKKTKAIMPVHLYGMPANLKEIKKIAKEFKLKIIEDAAPAIGSKYNKMNAGGIGDFSAFSFQGAKLLVTGEGGMLTTNNKKLYMKAKKIWDFGRDVNKTFWINEEGLKYKMSNVQAAIGLGQLERLEVLVQKKRKINYWYKKYLIQKNFKLIQEKKNTKSIYWMNCILIKNNFNRQKLSDYLKKKGIDSRPCFPSISTYPIWKKYKKDKLVNSKTVSNYGLNLPSGVMLKENDIKRISNEINFFLNKN